MKKFPLTPALSPRRGGRGGRVGIDGDPHAFAAEHEPDDAKFPVLEPINIWVGVVVEIKEGARGDEVLAPALAVGKEKGDVGDLFGQDADGTVHPDHLLIGIGQCGPGCLDIAAGQPGERLGRELAHRRRFGGGPAGDVEAENVHFGFTICDLRFTRRWGWRMRREA